MCTMTYVWLVISQKMHQFSKYRERGSINQYPVLIEVKPTQSHILDGSEHWLALYHNFFMICCMFTYNCNCNNIVRPIRIT